MRGNIPYTSVLKVFDPWKSYLCTCPPKFSLHPYTGCSHKCLYCYATSYLGFRKSNPKENFALRLKRDLRKLPKGVLVNLSTSSDPYPPIEEKLGLTRSALRVLAEHGARILITTKSDLVTRDADLLLAAEAAVTITITSLDKSLARIVEPGAPPPRKRLHALSKLASLGIPVGIRLDPVIPFLNDYDRELRSLLEAAHGAGARFVVTSTYKVKPDNFRRLVDAFPELRSRWRRLYYEEGEVIHGYRYLPAGIRARILRPVAEAAKALGLEYATCREGFRARELFNAGSCDGSHLISRLQRSRRTVKGER